MIREESDDIRLLRPDFEVASDIALDIFDVMPKCYVALVAAVLLCSKPSCYRDEDDHNYRYRASG